MYIVMFNLMCMYPVFQGYNWYREWCGMKKAATFDELVELPVLVVDKFQQLYGSVFMFYIRLLLTFTHLQISANTLFTMFFYHFLLRAILLVRILVSVAEMEPGQDF